MDIGKWKRVLLQWIAECGFIGRNYIHLEQTDINEFYNGFLLYHSLVQRARSKPCLCVFLREHYPDFVPQMENQHFLCPSEYVYVYSLLLHFSCVKCPKKAFQNICKRLPQQTQNSITFFFDELGTYTAINRQKLSTAIGSAEVNNASLTSVNVANNPSTSTCERLPQSSCQSTCRLRASRCPSRTYCRNSSTSPPPPTPSMLEQHKKKLDKLRAQLKTERQEKRLLEARLEENEEYMKSLNEAETKSKSLAESFRRNLKSDEILIIPSGAVSSTCTDCEELKCSEKYSNTCGCEEQEYEPGQLDGDENDCTNIFPPENKTNVMPSLHQTHYHSCPNILHYKLLPEINSSNCCCPEKLGPSCADMKPPEKEKENLDFQEKYNNLDKKYRNLLILLEKCIKKFEDEVPPVTANKKGGKEDASLGSPEYVPHLFEFIDRLISKFKNLSTKVEKLEKLNDSLSVQLQTRPVPSEKSCRDVTDLVSQNKKLEEELQQMKRDKAVLQDDYQKVLANLCSLKAEKQEMQCKLDRCNDRVTQLSRNDRLFEENKALRTQLDQTKEEHCLLKLALQASVNKPESLQTKPCCCSIVELSMPKQILPDSRCERENREFPEAYSCKNINTDNMTVKLTEREHQEFLEALSTIKSLGEKLQHQSACPLKKTETSLCDSKKMLVASASDVKTKLEKLEKIQSNLEDKKLNFALEMSKSNNNVLLNHELSLSKAQMGTAPGDTSTCKTQVEVLFKHLGSDSHILSSKLSLAQISHEVDSVISHQLRNLHSDSCDCNTDSSEPNEPKSVIGKGQMISGANLKGHETQSMKLISEKETQIRQLKGILKDQADKISKLQSENFATKLTENESSKLFEAVSTIKSLAEKLQQQSTCQLKQTEESSKKMLVASASDVKIKLKKLEDIQSTLGEKKLNFAIEMSQSENNVLLSHDLSPSKAQLCALHPKHGREVKLKVSVKHIDIHTITSILSLAQISPDSDTSDERSVNSDSRNDVINPPGSNKEKVDISNITMKERETKALVFDADDNVTIIDAPIEQLKSKKQEMSLARLRTEPSNSTPQQSTPSQPIFDADDNVTIIDAPIEQPESKKEEMSLARLRTEASNSTPQQSIQSKPISKSKPKTRSPEKNKQISPPINPKPKPQPHAGLIVKDEDQNDISSITS